jgi:hypothetical protein
VNLGAGGSELRTGQTKDEAGNSAIKKCLLDESSIQSRRFKPILKNAGRPKLEARRFHSPLAEPNQRQCQEKQQEPALLKSKVHGQTVSSIQVVA